MILMHHGLSTWVYAYSFASKNTMRLYEFEVPWILTRRDHCSYQIRMWFQVRSSFIWLSRYGGESLIAVEEWGLDRIFALQKKFKCYWMDRNTSACNTIASIETSQQDHPLASHGSLPCRGRGTVTEKVVILYYNIILYIHSTNTHITTRQMEFACGPNNYATS